MNNSYKLKNDKTTLPLNIPRTILLANGLSQILRLHLITAKRTDPAQLSDIRLLAQNDNYIVLMPISLQEDWIEHQSIFSRWLDLFTVIVCSITCKSLRV
jgi:hypothetical protein